MAAITLSKGTQYDISAMRLVGWTDGDGSGCDGYQITHYFEPDGTYKGADECGIEPIVESAS